MAVADALGLPQDHFRSVTVTTLAAIAGMVAGVISASYVSNPKADMGLFIMFGHVIVVYPILQGLGIDVGDFGIKDHLYVLFMVFSLWFVTWTIILTQNIAL